MAGIPRLEALTLARRIGLGAAIGLALALVLSLLRRSDLVEGLELELVDLRTRTFAGERGPDPRIVLMQVEEEDVAWVRENLGVPWPWPLTTNAHLVRTLDEAGATALMVDVLHLDRGAGPDDLPPGRELTTAEQQQRQIEEADAAEYGRALEAFGKAALAFELSDAPEYDLPLRREAAGGRLGAERAAPAAAGLARRGAELPVSHAAQGAALLGFSNTLPDLDGVVRRAPVVGRWGGRPVLSLPLATARLATGAAADVAAGRLRLARASQALNADDTFLVDFRRAAVRGVYPRVAPAQVLDWAVRAETEGALPAEAGERLGGRIVVYGVNLAGVKDLVPSPLGEVMDGPAFQATVLDNLLHGDGRVRAGRGLDTALLVLLLALVGLAGGALRGRWAPHLVPATVAVLFVVGAFAWFGAGTSIDLFTPLLGLLLTWAGTTALRLFTEGRRNRWLEGTFGRYMAPSIIAALKQDPTLLVLGGRERDISVLFSDVAGFTRISTQLSAAQVVSLLNRYLTQHCAPVLAEGGVVDKFEGDAVMAFFGDPVPSDDHALRACRAAVQVIRDLPALRPTWEAMGLDSFAIRIGINSGVAVVGNMGSDQRFDYTCMGDTVNLASRLEGAAKAFGATILIGPKTAGSVGDALVTRPLGRLVVVGRDEPVEVFELLDLREGASAELLDHVEAFARALEAARGGDFDTARAALDAAERLRPGDGPVTWLRGVIDAQAERGEPWDGVTVLTAK